MYGKGRGLDISEQRKIRIFGTTKTTNVWIIVGLEDWQTTEDWKG